MVAVLAPPRQDPDLVNDDPFSASIASTGPLADEDEESRWARELDPGDADLLDLED